MTNGGQERPGPLDYDAELRRHDRVLRRAGNVRSGDRVLDIGCGTGHTTRQAARAARAGRAVGVDVSAPAIERARELAESEHLANVTYDCADAQVHPFPPGSFDLAISRFGTMFFRDPVAAFANIREALRPDGRLVMMVWQAGERNEWDVALRRSLGVASRQVDVTPPAPDPFALADAATVTEILETAGFADVAFTDVREPVFYGPDLDVALDWVQGFACTSQVLEQLDLADADRAVERLRQTLGAHLRADGVWFDSRAWIVTAHRH
jgi:SAM-dependent methyltransferase